MFIQFNTLTSNSIVLLVIAYDVVKKVYVLILRLEIVGNELLSRVLENPGIWCFLVLNSPGKQC